MTFDDTDYILGVWFAADPQNNNWYLWCKRLSDGVWIVETTYRWHKSTDAFDGKDDKNRYCHEVDKNAPEEYMLSAINTMFQLMTSTKYTAFKDVMLVQGDARKFLEMAKTRNWMHIKTVQ